MHIYEKKKGREREGEGGKGGKERYRTVLIVLQAFSVCLSIKCHLMHSDMIRLLSLLYCNTVHTMKSALWCVLCGGPRILYVRANRLFKVLRLQRGKKDDHSKIK